MVEGILLTLDIIGMLILIRWSVAQDDRSKAAAGGRSDAGDRRR